jgi:hypothetical protein
LNLRFLKSQLFLELEDQVPLDGLMLLIAKIFEKCGPHFKMNSYFFNYKSEGQPEIFVSFFTDQKFYQFKFFDQHVRSSSESLNMIRKTDFSVQRHRSVLKIFGESRITLFSELPESPKTLIDFQRDLEDLLFLNSR